MKFRIDYTYQENNNAVYKKTEHNFHFIDADNEKDAIEEFKKSFSNAKERSLEIKTIQKVGYV